MILRLLSLAVTAAGAAAALAACGGGTTLQVQPAAATRPAAAAKPAAAPAQQPATDCDAGRWTGAISPEGRPDGLDAGDAGAVYVWHDGDGWHIRTTDARPTDHHYTGIIRLSDGAFADMRPVRDEKDDRVTVGGDGLLH